METDLEQVNYLTKHKADMSPKEKLWEQERDNITDWLIGQLGLTLAPIQETALEHRAYVQINRSSRRTRKTFTATLDPFRMLTWGAIFNQVIHVMFAAPSQKVTRRMWDHFWMFYDLFKLDRFDCYKDAKHNRYSASSEEKYFRAKNGTFIITSSCKDPEMNDIRGDWYDCVCVDEFENIPYKEAFLAATAYSQRDPGPLNKLWVIGTQDIKIDLGETFDRLHKLGQNPNQLDVKSWSFTMDDLPLEAQNKPAADRARKLVSRDDYLREDRNIAIPPTGLMFKDFNTALCHRDCPYDPNYDYGIGVDPGLRKPAVVFCQYINKEVRIFRELNPKDILIDQLIKEIQLIIDTEIRTPPVVLGIDKASKTRIDKGGSTYTTLEKFKQAFPMTRYTSSGELTKKVNQIFYLKKLVKENKLIINTSCKKFLTFILKATPDINLHTGAINSAGWKKVAGIEDPGDAKMYWAINYGPTSELVVPKDDEEMSVKDMVKLSRQLRMTISAHL